MREVLAGMNGLPRYQREAASLKSHLKIWPVAGSQEGVVVTPGEKSVC
jgi:hypothetical protein